MTAWITSVKAPEQTSVCKQTIISVSVAYRFISVVYMTKQFDRPLRSARYASWKFVWICWVYDSIFTFVLLMLRRDSSVGITLGDGLDDRGYRVRFPAGAGNFSLPHRVQNGSEAHPASYPMGTRSSFPVGKAAGEWSWPFTSISCRGQRMSGAIPPLPQYAYMAWCSVQAQGQLYLYLIRRPTFRGIIKETTFFSHPYPCLAEELYTPPFYPFIRYFTCVSW
jgi:hypothetical protein